LREYFLHFKDDDADGLSPGKKEDAEMWEMDRKDALLFMFVNYMCKHIIEQTEKQRSKANWKYRS